MEVALSIAFGACVGLALGLTGGGGSLLAVPLLVYGLRVPAREAFGISLAAVGTTALLGVVPRLRGQQIEITTGALFAVGGMVGAPAGTWFAQRIPESVLLLLFASLMLLVAVKMWRQRDAASQREYTRQAICQRTPDGRLELSARCVMLMAAVGLLTGFLAGMFGVGGGFVIVPALIFFSGMAIHRAVGTSLLVIFLISISGVVSHFASGRGISLQLTALFVLGGVIGLTFGSRVARYLSPGKLQRVFAVGIVAVAFFVVGKTLA